MTILKKQQTRLMLVGENVSGVALTELAIIFPIFLFMILGLLELSNYAIQRQRLSQAALQIADNAGRLGESGFGGSKRISEKQITDTLLGGITQADKLDLKRNGRIILSSLETNADGGQWLHWQRCYGELIAVSSYGREGDGKAGTAFVGMGPVNSRIFAGVAQPVMFVELAYKLKPIAIPYLIPKQAIIETASMPVRAERNLTSVSSDTDGKPSTC